MYVSFNYIHWSPWLPIINIGPIHRLFAAILPKIWPIYFTFICIIILSNFFPDMVAEQTIKKETNSSLFNVEVIKCSLKVSV